MTLASVPRGLAPSHLHLHRIMDRAAQRSSCLRLHGHTSACNVAVFSPDAQLIASVSQDKSVRVWSAITGVCMSVLTGHSLSVSAVSFSIDGSQLLSASLDKTIKVWQLSTEQCLLTLLGHTGAVTSASWSPDGTRLASGSWDCSVRVWNQAGAVTAEMCDHDKGTTVVSEQRLSTFRCE